MKDDNKKPSGWKIVMGGGFLGLMTGLLVYIAQGQSGNLPSLLFFFGIIGVLIGFFIR